MNRIKSFVVAVIIVTCSTIVFSQNTEVTIKKNREFSEAVSLFDNQKYTAAQQKFIHIASSDMYSQTLRVDAEYYTAVCALRLFNGDAEILIKQFIKLHPESTRIFHAYFEYANYLFREQKYPESLIWYELVDIKKFNNVEISEYFYKIGYSYFKNNDYAKAKPFFKEVKDSKSVYAQNALFYFSYLEYIDKQYDSALKGFEFLADSTMFSPVVPPYMCQIYYIQKQYDKVIQYARTIEGIVNPQQLPEVYRVLAGAYFKTLQFNSALPYYEKYIQASPSPAKEDLYELGYLYYRDGKYEKAADLFQQVTSHNDTIAQNAYYHLGDCYVKLGDKDKARNAFMAAMQYSVFPSITEDATFIHAKLIYELSYAPFNEAITATQAFLTKYPKSKYKDEANSLLVKIFMSSKNYKDALVSLEQIKVLTSDLKIAYQQIAYYRGLELINNIDYAQAIEMFDKSLQYGAFDRSMQAYSIYWKAECFYKLSQYDKARSLFNEFVLIPGAFNSTEYKRAHYSIGYTFFEQERFADAATWFRKYLDIADNTKDDFYSDAAIRAGDCYYMLKDFKQAIRFYTIAVQIGKFDVEYALFQEAFCQGLAGNHEAKISSLIKFMKLYPSSLYYDDALFEQAEAYMKAEQIVKASENYTIIVSNYKSSSYIKKSLLQLAFIEYNKQNLDEALLMYQRVLQQYPGSQESQTALNMIRNIYKKKNDIDGFSNYVKQIGGHANVTEAQLDSLSFEVAQELYLDGECDKALPLLSAYIQKYGEGFFLLHAHFYRAECFFSKGYEFEALPDYEYVLQFTKNSFTESSLVNASRIAINSFQYEKALEFLKRLENEAELKPNLLIARKGLMLCYDKTKEYKKVVESGDKFVVTEKITNNDKRWAYLLMAQAFENMQDSVNALVKYKTVALEHSTKEGAEARYKVVSYLSNQKKYDEAEKEIIDFLEKNSPHQYWLGKTYILWAHIFVQRNELFQARYTLQNVMQHYKIKDDGIIQEANDMLNLIADIEIGQKQKAQEEVVIPMGDNPELFKK
ncbi:MAG: tetratricopeptide repeat protein [Bacteroidetes bacterium ADurb.Bin217]|nr:MAG: tetratricopeptide repeat protein [Bacteroidetes bacterium ADurb.Bin217]